MHRLSIRIQQRLPRTRWRCRVVFRGKLQVSVTYARSSYFFTDMSRSWRSLHHGIQIWPQRWVHNFEDRKNEKTSRLLQVTRSHVVDARVAKREFQPAITSIESRVSILTDAKVAQRQKVTWPHAMMTACLISEKPRSNFPFNLKRSEWIHSPAEKNISERTNKISLLVRVNSIFVSF